MMRLVGQVGGPITFFFSQLQMFRHRLDPWPPGPFGRLFKPPRSKRASIAPPSHLFFLLSQFLPPRPSETRDSTRVPSPAFHSGAALPLHLPPSCFLLAVEMLSHPKCGMCGEDIKERKNRKEMKELCDGFICKARAPIPSLPVRFPPPPPPPPPPPLSPPASLLPPLLLW
jgi:hypothetical protein